ncbi:MAG: hypothetical protein WD827_02915 [Solirubrobacterales bacterium]
MGSFKRALLGYRRQDVDAAVGARDKRIWGLEHKVEATEEKARLASVEAACAKEATAQAEQELDSLSWMVIEREREIRHLNEQLWEANQRHDRSIVSLESTAGRLEEIQAQARGQATRIRMKALREAVEVSRRTQELADAQTGATNGAEPSDAAEAESPAKDLFEGEVKVEIGPLGDFSQLVGFEDLIGNIGASEISVERFSEGRATLSMRLDEPVELLRELEERAALDFRVRRTSGDNLILDVDEDSGPGQRAA